MRKLTAKQALFVEEFLVDVNAKEAAIRAGYAEKRAKQEGYKLRRKPHVRAAIDKAMAARLEHTKAGQEWVVARLVENVERAMQLEPVTDGEGNSTGEHIYQGSVANKALELLGRHAGMFPNRHEHTGKNGEPIKFRPDLSKLNKEELNELERILSRATDAG